MYVAILVLIILYCHSDNNIYDFPFKKQLRR